MGLSLETRGVTLEHEGQLSKYRGSRICGNILCGESILAWKNFD